MKLPADCRYAIEALVYMALHTDDKPIRLSAISEQQHIPLAYLEQIFMKLRQQKIVSSVKGPGGGFKLNMSRHALSLAQIIQALDGEMQAMKCRGSANCSNGTPCLTHSLWDDLNHWVALFFTSISLQQVIDGSHKQLLDSMPKVVTQ